MASRLSRSMRQQNPDGFAEAVLIVSSGIATLMSFFRGVVMCRVPWSMDHRNGAGGSARSSHENAPD